MPELPEIETICQGLREKILNKTILEAQLLTNHCLRQEIPINISEKIANGKIIAVYRRAKYVQIFLDNAWVILIHLGMSGKILIKEDDYIYQKHDHLSILFQDGQQLVYNDPRRFGLIALLKEKELTDSPLLKNLGIEPLSPEFTSQYLVNLLANKKQPIKLTLMDNSNVVGVGNIYACESLFFSKILPTRESASLKLAEVILLHKIIIQVLKEAIKQGGSSLKDYASVSGEKGYFQHSFKVYGRERQNCLVCNNVILKIKQAGRSSFYCPICQN
jgi:formamidopyrimidine-DNA glycosylase